MLNIYSNDLVINFNIRYEGFNKLKKLFLISQQSESNLRILLKHSNYNGELTHKDCKKLLPCLHIDITRIHNCLNKNRYEVSYWINKMFEFWTVIYYCAANDGVKLIFS